MIYIHCLRNRLCVNVNLFSWLKIWLLCLLLYNSSFILPFFLCFHDCSSYFIILFILCFSHCASYFIILCIALFPLFFPLWFLLYNPVHCLFPFGLILWKCTFIHSHTLKNYSHILHYHIRQWVINWCTLNDK